MYMITRAWYMYNLHSKNTHKGWHKSKASIKYMEFVVDYSDIPPTWAKVNYIYMYM